jgi:hypothetical protein
MRPWTLANLALAVCVLVLLLIDRWPTGTDPRTRLTDLNTEAAMALRIERDRRLQIALQRGETGWQLTHPYASAADPRRVAQLLTIARAPVVRRFRLDDDPAQYGLDRPAAVLQIDAARIAFGDRDPTQRHRYALFADQVQVVDEVYYQLLTLPATHFTGP